jgi:valyl-tRNA synthetase
MVCHETYKDEKGKWISPDEIKKNDNNEFVKILDNSKIIVGPSESMSKSKKNVIDPENMIKLMVLMLLGGLFYLIALQKKMFNGLIKE